MTNPTPQAGSPLVDVDSVRARYDEAKRSRTTAAMRTALSDIPPLLIEIRHAGWLLTLTRTRYANLLAAARAAVAADWEGEPDPLLYVRDELRSRDQMPPRDLLPRDLPDPTHPTDSGGPR